MAVAKDIGLSHAAEAAADLSAKVNYLAKIDSNGRIALCGAGEQPLGMIIEGAAIYKPATIQFGGIAKVICGGAFAAGELVGSDANGAAVRIAVSPGGGGIGIALEAGVAGRIVAVAIIHAATLV